METRWGVVVGLVTIASLVLGRPSPGLAQENDTCLMCHSSRQMFQNNPRADSLVVDAERLAGSVHGRLSCVNCHQDLVDSEFPHAPELERPNCAVCHSGVNRVYEESVHGYALSRGNPRAPTCEECHGGHNVLPSSDPRSPTHKVRLPNTCARCHGTAGLLTDQLVKLPQSFTAYAESVHGQGAERGIATAASCSDCHGVHDLKGSVDPTSRINPANVARTCGQCHPDIQLEYDRSIHGRALETGVRDSPTCTDCHGEHLILSPEDPDARTSAAHQAVETCGRCHNDPIIISKYNLEGGVVGSYVDSYHGWVTRRGGRAAATCVSCHTAHLVLPEEDPLSTINPANLAETCGRCHKDADYKFASSYTHETTSITTNPINRVIRSFYIVVIIVVIGLMVLHNLVIMNYFMVERRKEEDHSPWVMRFDKSQIVQHLLTTIAFIVLVVTGFALRFPEAWWVEGLTELGMTETVRADLHRIFAVVMIVTAIYHMYYIFLTDRGRVEFRSIVPSWRDIRQAYDNLRYYTWQSDRKVKFERYDYTQKAEYWALIWGTILMIITGLILWFPQLAVKVFPAWIVPAAQTVHYYEAWLATLAIVVWHFFFVILHPEEYPMSWTWLTGRMSESSVKRHHAGWYEEMKEGGGAGSGSGDTMATAERYAPAQDDEEATR